MKRLVFLFTVLFLGAGLGEAMALCRGDRVGDLEALFRADRFVCAARTSGTDTWSEEHRSGGDLFEYAQGPGHPVDPSKVVGTWTVENNGPTSLTAVVKYSYTGDAGSPYTWSLFQLGPNSYLFCEADGNNAIATARISADPFPCGPRF